jgi:DNA-directed RNA polymerase omega subunit
LKSSTEIDSKFRFVIVAAKRAKQLIAGSKPKIKSKSKNPIRIAQMEVNKGLVHYDIIEPKKDQVRKPEEEGFIGEKIREISEEPIKKYKGKAKKKVAKPKDKPKDKAKDKPKDKPKAKPKDKPKAKSKDKPKDKAKEKPKKKNKGDKT